MAADRDDLERIRQAVNLVELFEGVTTVRKVRGTFKALCPFHTEKTPSVSIDPARGLYHCFGCGVGGDVFTFVQETQGLDFGETVEILADRVGIVVRRDPGAARRRERRGRLVEAVEAAGRFYHSRLKGGADAGHARAYVRSRDYDVDVIDQFLIGYAPDEFDALISHLRGQGFTEREIHDSGLGRRAQTGRLFDQMRGRLMFPIHNVRGEMVGFGGRLLQGEGPKYLNTAETPLYKKSELLYGLDRARSAISRVDTAVVVEGYTDVIAFHLAEMPLAVATCGTALGEDHFDLLRRFASRIVLAFDADAAGAGAAIRGDELRITSELELDLRVAEMPEGKDPADLVQEGGTERLKQAVERSRPITEFRINQVLGRHDLRELAARTRAMREAAALIARHPDRDDRHQHAIDVAGRTHFESDRVLREIQNILGRNDQAPPDEGSVPVGRGTRHRLDRSERELLRHLLAGNAPRERITQNLFQDEHAYRLAAWLLDAGRHLEPGVPIPLDGMEDHGMAATARRLAVMEEPPDPVEDVLAHLETRYRDRRKDELGRRLESMDPGADPEGYSQRVAELIALLQREPRIAEE